MSVTRFRIPRMAAAALVLGSSACGDDDKGGTPGGTTSGVNVSRGRVKSIVGAICKQEAACRDDEDYDYAYADQPATVDECTNEAVDEFFSSYADLLDDQDGKKCLDALLDYYACYATLACDATDAEEEAKCGAAGETYYAICKSFFDSDYASYDYAVSGRRQRVKRALRIPR